MFSPIHLHEVQKYNPSRNQEATKKRFVNWIFEWIPKHDNIVFNFFRESSLHGLKYLGILDVHIVSRILWLIAVAYLGVHSIDRIVTVIEKFYKNPVMVSFQPYEIALEQIPFPGVTICNANNIRKSEVLKVIKSHNEAQAGSLQANETLLEMYYMQTICDNAGTFSSHFDYYKEKIPISEEQKAMLKQHHNIEPNVTKMVMQTMQGCSDMIKLCAWNSKPRKCSDLFQQIYTDFGPCCVFNMMPIQLLLRNVRKSRHHKLPPERLERWESWDIDEDILATNEGSVRGPPRHQRKPGRDAGLSFMVDPEIDDYFCPSQDSMGFQLLVESPLNYPKVKDFGSSYFTYCIGLGVQPNTETFFDVRPELTMIDDSIENLPASKRHCYLSGEYNLTYFKFYTIKNCIEECLSRFTYASCNCTLFNMPRDSFQRVCFEDDYPCARLAESNISTKGANIACEKCLPECTQIKYEASMSKLPMNEGLPIWKYRGTNESHHAPWAQDNVTIIHVYFGSDSVYSRVRSRIFDSSDLLGNAGGLLGLYLGLSVVSVLEIFYHFFFKIFFEQDKAGQYFIGKTFRKLKACTSKLTSVGKIRVNLVSTHDRAPPAWIHPNAKIDKTAADWATGTICF